MTDLYHRILALHRKVYIGSGGKLGHRLLFGNPTLLLRATGRRTGKERVTALTYAEDGADVLVVASAGGADRAPAWLGNLQADPDCEVQIGSERRRSRAHVTGPDDQDYARRWALMDAVNKGRYTEHQAKTSRTIPIVVLSPVE